jgi:6-phosphogluconolactonase
MKLPLALAILLIPLAAFAQPERFYIGTFTRPGGSEGIYTTTLDSDTGQLGLIVLSATARSPGYLAFSPAGSHLYAITSNNGGGVAAFEVGRDGALTAQNIVSSAGAGPAHLAVDPTGTNVLVANYGNGVISSIRIKPDGSLGECASSITFSGSGPNVSRQQAPHAHFITLDGSGKFVYACDLGTDHVWGYHFDAATGKIGEPVDPQATVPPGSGPRHFAFGKDEAFAYANGEMGRNVTAFRHDKATGVLTPIQTLPLIPGSNPDPTVTTAEIFVHPSGKWLYVSSRGDEIIAVFAIGDDGKLTFVQSVPCGVKTPRGFGIDPTGKWLITGGQDGGGIAVLAIDPATGKLTPTKQAAQVSAAVCILFQPTPGN